MATGKQSTDITHCAICLEILDIPKCLPCLHTFCEKCIVSYIAYSIEKDDKTNIGCPVCRTNLSPPAENCSPEDWAKKLPLNCLIFGLLEKKKIERAEKQCMSCERLGNSTIALFVCVECSDALCDNCYQCHKANKFTSRHKTVSISDISEVERSLNFFRSDCPDHVSEELKLFCVDHDIPCCSLCVSVTHRKCNEVVTLDQAANGFMASDVADKIKESLGNIEKDALLLISHNKTCEECVTTQFDVSSRDIDSYFSKLQSRIENMKQNLKDNLIKISNEKKEGMATNVIVLENLTKKVENEKKILQTSLQKASPFQVMTETKQLKTKLEQHTKTVSQAYANTFDYKLTFKHDKEIKRLAMEFENNVSVVCETTASILDLVTIPTMKLQLKYKINHGGYAKDCFYSKEQYVVLLHSNKTVRSYDQTGKQIYSVYPYNVNNRRYTPSAIAEGQSGEIVVSYSSTSTIEFMNKNGSSLGEINGPLATTNSITMLKVPELLIASDGRKISMFKTSGQQTFAFNTQGAKYLCVNSKPRLYYVESKNIICKTLEGTQELKIALETADAINGFSVDPKGNIFVSSTQTNTVCLLSATGSIRTTILTEKDGLCRPSSIRCSFDGQTMLVVNKDNTEILCYEILLSS